LPRSGEAVKREAGEVESGWRGAEESASVVGQDKGNASLDRATTQFRRFRRSFFTRHDDAHASDDRVGHASHERAANTAPRSAEKRGIGPARRHVPRLTAALVFALFTLVVPAVLGRFFHLRITITDSAAPAGIYRLIAAPAGRGELVAACLPAAIARAGLARGYLRKGDCPAGAEPVAKVIGALPGDLVELAHGQVVINGVPFANSRISARDSAGRPLSHEAWGAYHVEASQVWLFGFNDARSWDARYFGPVPLANVRGVLKPVVTW
jgi:conjugative transfer signal peptidase TraF